jgi:hypothetical protein
MIKSRRGSAWRNFAYGDPAKPTKIAAPYEESEQISFFGWLATAHWRGLRLGEVAYHIPNGGSRHKLEAYKLKKMGVRRSIPDVHLPISAGPFHTLYIELKRRGGRGPNAEQENEHARLRQLGHSVEVAYGADEAREAVLRYLALTEVEVIEGGSLL